MPCACVVTSLLSTHEVFHRLYVCVTNTHARIRHSVIFSGCFYEPLTFPPRSVSCCTHIVYMHTCVVLESTPCCCYSELLIVLSSSINVTSRQCFVQNGCKSLLFAPRLKHGASPRERKMWRDLTGLSCVVLSWATWRTARVYLIQPGRECFTNFAHTYGKAFRPMPIFNPIRPMPTFIHFHGFPFLKLFYV